MEEVVEGKGRAEQGKTFIYKYYNNGSKKKIYRKGRAKLLKENDTLNVNVFVLSSTDFLAISYQRRHTHTTVHVHITRESNRKEVEKEYSKRNQSIVYQTYTTYLNPYSRLNYPSPPTPSFR